MNFVVVRQIAARENGSGLRFARRNSPRKNDRIQRSDLVRGTARATRQQRGSPPAAAISLSARASARSPIVFRRACVFGKVNAFDELVGFQQQVFAGFGPEHRAVVADAADAAVMRCEDGRLSPSSFMETRDPTADPRRRSGPWRPDDPAARDPVRDRGRSGGPRSAWTPADRAWRRPLPRERADRIARFGNLQQLLHPARGDRRAAAPG